MALLDILHFPDPRLRNKASPVDEVDANIRKLVDDMFETMYDAPGIGLAAVQVNVPLEVIVIDISTEKSDPRCFINPRVVEECEHVETEEGCLSVPGVYETVQRARQVTVSALNARGEPFEIKADGILGVCIQHEMDHLQGRLFVDYLSRLKRQRIRKRALKQLRDD
ncbi:MAG: peptide deformylase [Gammaproteobacteria bacterium]